MSGRAGTGETEAFAIPVLDDGWSLIAFVCAIVHANSVCLDKCGTYTLCSHSVADCVPVVELSMLCLSC